MLTELHRRLYALLTTLALPVCTQGSDAACGTLPYLSFLVEAPLSFGGRGRAIVTVWTPSGADHALRLQLADRVAALIPAHGLMLRTDGGLAQLRPAGERRSQSVTAPGLQGLELPFDLTVYHTPRKEA